MSTLSELMKFADNTIVMISVRYKTRFCLV